LDVYHTGTHGVALVHISDAGLKRAARGLLKVQDAKHRQKFAICAPSHNFVGPYLRPLVPVICWRVWDTPANFSCRVPTNLESLELSGNFVNMEKSGNLRYGQGIFCDMSHGS